MVGWVGSTLLVRFFRLAKFRMACHVAEFSRAPRATPAGIWDTSWLGGWAIHNWSGSVGRLCRKRLAMLQNSAALLVLCLLASGTRRGWAGGLYITGPVL